MTEQVTRSITVKATPEKTFAVLSNFFDYPKFIQDIQTVQPRTSGLTHWKIDGPLGKSLEFDLEVTKLDKNQRIAWSTKDFPGDLTTSGQIVLAPLPNHQTEVTVMVNYDVEGLAGLLTGNLEEKVDKLLRNFKAYLEGMPEAYEI